MAAYWKAVARHLATAAVDVIFVAGLSLAPFLLGRLVALIKQSNDAEKYWAFLFNGQLSFFSMGMLAALLLLCFRKKLPDTATMSIGVFTVGCMLFLVVLVGYDPTLQAGQNFIGPWALYLFLVVLAIRIIAEAMKSVGAGDALQAGSAVAARSQRQLSERMGGGQ